MADRGQMGVDGCGLYVLVAQILLQLGDRYARLEQMGGEAVAQGVAGSLLGHPGAHRGLAHAALQRTQAHRFGCRSHALAHFFGRSATAAHLRKEPHRVAVAAPVLLQLAVHLKAEQRVAILAALALAHDQLVIGPVDIVDRELHALADAQTTGVDQRQWNPVAQQRYPGKYRPQFRRAEHTGQILAVPGPDQSEQRPVPLQHVVVEPPRRH